MDMRSDSISLNVIHVYL